MKKKYFLWVTTAIFFLTSICHAERFVNNGDETVTDTRTGLMWEKKTNDGGDRDKGNTYLWEQAIAYCEQLMLSGHTDWRLPTIKELASIADLTRYNPAIDTGFFPITVSSDYWSSSTDANLPDYAWSVEFYNGDGYNTPKSDDWYVRAVRGGQSRALGHLVIFEPRQASNWDIGSVMPITWDPGDVPGTELVIISFSRNGGKEDGTFEQLSPSRVNDGYFEWTVTGPATDNGYLKIEPVSSALKDKGTSISLFSIKDYILVEEQTFTLNENPPDNTAEFRIKLTQAPTEDVVIRLASKNNHICNVYPPLMKITPADWPTGALARVTAVDNAEKDGDRTCLVQTSAMESLDILFDGMVAPDVTVTVADDDINSLDIKSIQPNEAAANDFFAPMVYGSGLTNMTAGQVILYQEDENGDPHPTHNLAASMVIPEGSKMRITFGNIAWPGSYNLSIGKSGLDKPVILRNAVTIREADSPPLLEGKKAIIVAGKKDIYDPLQPETRFNANWAYETLLWRGYTNDTIHYLTHQSVDVDGKEGEDNDAVPSIESLRDAITLWAVDADEVILYMVDHGSTDTFHLDKDVTVTADQLRTWLDTLQSQQNHPVRVIVIIDACRSGSLIEGLKPVDIHPASERIVITATGSQERTWFKNGGIDSFSYNFWNTIYNTGGLYYSFIQSSQFLIKKQTPEADIDESGSSEPYESADYLLGDLADGSLTEIIIGRPGGSGVVLPVVGEAYASLSVNQGDPSTTTLILDCDTAEATFFASSLKYSGRLSRVYADITPPWQENQDLNDPATDAIEINMFDSNDGELNKIYSGTHNDFSRPGVYIVSVRAEESDEESKVASIPENIRVIKTCGSSQKGDIYIDLSVDLNDALIALKVLAGMPLQPGDIRPDYSAANGDVNGNDRVELAEVIYILQKAAGLR